MATLGSKVGEANDDGKESHIDSVPMWPPENDGVESGESVVRLPTVDYRQPNKDGAKTEVTRKKTNLKNSLAYSLLFPLEPQIRVKLPTITSTINFRDQPLQQKTRLRTTRGTRGRGDYRNARMRADRIRWAAEQRVERQSTHFSVMRPSKCTSAFLSITLNSSIECKDSQS